MIRSLLATYRAAFAGLGRPVWLLSLASLINRAGTMVMPFLLLFLVEKRGFTTTEAGQTLALYGVVAMAASYAGGRLCDRFGAGSSRLCGRPVSTSRSRARPPARSSPSRRMLSGRRPSPRRRARPRE